MIIEPSDLSDNDIIATVESALAAGLDIHPSALEVSYDNESGILTYVITSDDMGEISNAITSITDEDFISDLYIGNDISIESIEVSNDIEMSMSMLVDASNVSDANMAAEAVIESIQNQDDKYEVTSRGIPLTKILSHKQFFGH